MLRSLPPRQSGPHTHPPCSDAKHNLQAGGKQNRLWYGAKHVGQQYNWTPRTQMNVEEGYGPRDIETSWLSLYFHLPPQQQQHLLSFLPDLTAGACLHAVYVFSMFSAWTRTRCCRMMSKLFILSLCLVFFPALRLACVRVLVNCRDRATSGRIRPETREWFFKDRA